jgi:hypothetical protein
MIPRFGKRAYGLQSRDLDRLAKVLSPRPAAERPHWRRQPLTRYRFDSGLRDFLATEAAALAGSK